mmetsp:Transcript_59481/g.94466  ORF Transcript_59481/g.94466 Transcript_59481/m.94466 type:complete len:263 (-) Transcript_59481:788-1576(-)
MPVLDDVRLGANAVGAGAVLPVDAGSDGSFLASNACRRSCCSSLIAKAAKDCRVPCRTVSKVAPASIHQIRKESVPISQNSLNRSCRNCNSDLSTHSETSTPFLTKRAFRSAIEVAGELLFAVSESECCSIEDEVLRWRSGAGLGAEFEDELGCFGGFSAFWVLRAVDGLAFPRNGDDIRLCRALSCRQGVATSGFGTEESRSNSSKLMLRCILGGSIAEEAPIREFDARSAVLEEEGADRGSLTLASKRNRQLKSKPPIAL